MKNALTLHNGAGKTIFNKHVCGYYIRDCKSNYFLADIQKLNTFYMQQKRTILPINHK